VIAQEHVNPGDAILAIVEVVDFLRGHANVDFCFPGVGLLLCKSRQFVAEVLELLRVEPAFIVQVAKPYPAWLGELS
jgi:hypothetical protein